jgi:hypothetical protein
MAELGWTAVRVHGLTRGGYLEQVRVTAASRSATSKAFRRPHGFGSAAVR